MKKPFYSGWYLIFPSNNFVWYSSEEEAQNQKLLAPCAKGPFWVTAPKVQEENGETRIPR